MTEEPAHHAATRKSTPEEVAGIAQAKARRFLTTVEDEARGVLPDSLFEVLDLTPHVAYMRAVVSSIGDDYRLTNEVLNEVYDERERQLVKWGRQDVPVLPTLAYRGLYGDQMRRHKSLNDRRATLKQLAWDSILLEEVYEALEELDPLKQEVELIQVAAVAVAMVECLRLRRCDCPDPDELAA